MAAVTSCENALFASTNRMHFPDLGSDTSSVWNFCARLPDVISGGNQWWRRREMLAFPRATHKTFRESFKDSQQFLSPCFFTCICDSQATNDNP